MGRLKACGISMLVRTFRAVPLTSLPGVLLEHGNLILSELHNTKAASLTVTGISFVVSV